MHDPHFFTRYYYTYVMKSWAVRIGEKKNTHGILVKKAEGKRPVGRHSHRWEDNTEVDLKEVRWEGVRWINVTQDSDKWRAVMSTVTYIPIT